MRTRSIIITAALAMAAGFFVVGFIWVTGHIDSYDRRYQDCMTGAQARLNHQGHYFPDDAYDQAMRECERSAGAPVPEGGHPGVWEAP